jgi:hypothetical protein
VSGCGLGAREPKGPISIHAGSDAYRTGNGTSGLQLCLNFSLEDETMVRPSRGLSTLLLALAVSASATGIACEHHYYRVYDPYYTDYHVWNGDEVRYYNQWAVETHRDPHRDFRKLPPNEQKEYWTWRHNHGDHDHH